MILRTQIIYFYFIPKDILYLSFSLTFSSFTRITGGSYQAPFKAFYTRSSNKVYQKLGKLLLVGPSVLDGLQQALEHK